MRVRIIANPVSGRGRGQARGQALYDALAGRVEHRELVVTDRPRAGLDEAARPGADCIVVVGGDGSLNEALNGMGDAGAILAILPAGTANVVARELGVGPDPGALADLIAAGRARWVDAGVSSMGRKFLLGAGAGLDAAVAARYEQLRGGRPGSSMWAWVRPAVECALRYTYPKIRVTVDGAVVSESAQYAIVGNCRYSAGLFPATPKARIDDGLLDVCLAHDLRALRLPGLAMAVWNPRFIERADIVYAQGRAVRFEAADGEAAPVQHDGDPGGALPMEFRVIPSALRMISAIDPD